MCDDACHFRPPTRPDACGAPGFAAMPSTTREMTIPHLGFVGGLLYAVRRAGRSAPPEPPDHLRCPISCDLFCDPVLLAQTGHTYDRVSIERWLRQKSPPSDPSSNVELHSTATVPNWALRDAVNEWRTAHGLPPLESPECATRRLAGGHNARDGLMGFAGLGVGTHSDNNYFVLRPVRVAVLSLLVASTQLLTSLGGACVSLVDGSSRRFLRNLGVPQHAQAHFAAFTMLACACGLTASGIILLERIVQAGTTNQSLLTEIGSALRPAQNAVWWAAVFSAVWLANGGFVDPVRADAERRARADAERRAAAAINRGAALVRTRAGEINGHVRRPGLGLGWSLLGPASRRARRR